jgi:hypothetical protein
VIPEGWGVHGEERRRFSDQQRFTQELHRQPRPSCTEGELDCEPTVEQSCE